MAVLFCTKMTLDRFVLCVPDESMYSAVVGGSVL